MRTDAEMLNVKKRQYFVFTSFFCFVHRDCWFSVFL